MNKTEFNELCKKFIVKTLLFSEKARREGLLSLEDELYDYDEKLCERDIFLTGMRLVVDGVDKRIIEKILSNLIDQEKDEKTHLLKTMQKEAILLIYEGASQWLVYQVLDSYIDDSLSKEIEKLLHDKTNQPDNESDDLDLSE
jgi:flagellar motor component MotA